MVQILFAMRLNKSTKQLIAVLTVIAGVGAATVYASEIALTSTGPSKSSSQHMGCQPGSIEKDGTCTVAASNDNADVFSAEGLKPVTSENTTVNGAPGYHVRPSDNKTYPSVILIHEWWGLNSNIRHMADILAGHGYSVFAVDLYNGETARNSSKAGRLSGQVRQNPEQAIETMSNAVQGMRSKKSTTSKVASLGWCFGGGQSLQLSLSDTNLDSTVIYYGTLTSNKTRLKNIEQPVLGIFGEDDRVVSTESVKQFNSTLDSLGVESTVKLYEDAGHAFANPSGQSFNPEATKDAWTTTLRFLDRSLK